MEKHIPTRNEAFELVKQYIKTDSLVKHALAVEAVMRYYAKAHGEDEEQSGTRALERDFSHEDLLFSMEPIFSSPSAAPRVSRDPQKMICVRMPDQH